MCGLFGFAQINSERRTISTRRVLRLAHAMDRRGGHASGLAVPASTPSTIDYWREAWLARELLPLLVDDLRASAPLFGLGHTRFATHGDSSNADNLHPHPYSRDDGAGAITHNGVLWDHERTAVDHGVDLVGECDSELFARLIEADADDDLLARVRHSIEACDPCDDIALAVGEVTDDGRHRIVLAARGNPLHYTIHRSTLWWASTPAALPGHDSRRLPERAMMDVVVGRGEAPVILAATLPPKSHRSSTTQGYGYGYGWQSYGAATKAATKAATDDNAHWWNR